MVKFNYKMTGDVKVYCYLTKNSVRMENFNVQKSCGISKIDTISVGMLLFPVGINLEAIFSPGTLFWDQIHSGVGVPPGL